MKKAVAFNAELPQEIDLQSGRTFRPKEITWEFPQPIYLTDNEGNTLDMLTKPSRFITKITEGDNAPEYKLILKLVRPKKSRK